MLQMMESLVAESESIREGIGQTVVRNLKVMARMGVIFEDADAPPVSRVSSACRRPFLGRISAAAQRESAPPCGKVRCLRSRFGRIEIAFHANFLANIFEQLQRSLERTSSAKFAAINSSPSLAGNLLAQIERARVWLRAACLKLATAAASSPPIPSTGSPSISR